MQRPHWLTRWWRQRTGADRRIPFATWHAAVDGLTCLRGLSAVERARLRVRVTWFLQHKTLNGVQGLELSPAMRIQIAAQACLPILNLGTEYFDGWYEVIVYPGSFRVPRSFEDDAGVVSESEQILSGEAWERGPVILAWSDIEQDRYDTDTTSNVIIHEFAHKLDMLNGSANGMPPLHAEMSRPTWTRAWTTAYAALRHRLARHETPTIDPYGETDPAEFFAVASEYFFTAPWSLLDEFPAVYEQLRQFYRQDPAARLAR